MFRLIKYFIALLNLPRIILHLFLFCFYFSKCKEDVVVALKHRFTKEGDLILGFIFLIIWDKTFRNVFYFRIGKWKYLIQWLAPQHDCFEINTYAEIGPGLLGVHPFASYLNAEKVGSNFVIKNNVTIGNDDQGNKPVIGDNVIIHVNCVVFGNITIGNNVVIGAGSIVYKDVPPNCVVVGNPARIVRRNGIRVNEEL